MKIYLSYLHLYFHYILLPISPVMSFVRLDHQLELLFCWFIIIFSSIIWLSWNPTLCNILRWRVLFLIFWWNIRLWLQLMHISGFCIQGITRINSWGFVPIIRFITKWNNCWVFYVSWSYSTMNTTTFFHFSPTIISSARRLLCCSIMTILLKLVIISRLIILSIMFSTMKLTLHKNTNYVLVSFQ